jgi:hypothetical protein
MLSFCAESPFYDLVTLEKEGVELKKIIAIFISYLLKGDGFCG